jgi:peptidyl-tRNA hydrolase, PTH1 family
VDIPTKLIVGLGNPGREYEKTRHNVGFDVLDRLAERHGFTPPRREFRGLLREGRIADQRVFLLGPQTYMNLSGESLALFLRQKPLEPASLLVVADDIALPVGKLRLRGQGSAGGHNGLKSIIDHLGAKEFPRLRVGVGGPRDPSLQIDFVLGQFSRAERKIIDETIDIAVDAVESWIARGLEPTMNAYNGDGG